MCCKIMFLWRSTNGLHHTEVRIGDAPTLLFAIQSIEKSKRNPEWQPLEKRENNKHTHNEKTTLFTSL